MATRTDIPDLSDDDKAIVFHMLDAVLNRTILFAFLQGIYTGMVAFTLSKIFSRGRGVGKNAMALVIIVLCILTAINFAFLWSSSVYSFIHHGQNFWTVFVAITSRSGIAKLFQMGPGIAGCISTIVADSAMVWRCWIVWGRSWIIILLPLVFMVLGTAFKILQIRANMQATEPAVSFTTCTAIYVSLMLATTLLCTLLIVYRILSIEWAKTKLEGTRTCSFGAYRNVIEILVESAALYSAALTVFVVFVFQNEVDSGYSEIIAEFIRGVAPTLLIGRVASGHSRPDDSWKGSTISSLRFGTGRRTQTSTEASAEEGLMRSDDFVHDVEAQAPAGGPDEEKVNVCQRVEPEPVADKGV
ncbi:hypothetical protein ARMSODRAFT_1023041 [Armillaria solidipes]|uniref:Uncharacterized protein n=1 Tax=Armillaria solidipes TaxID=1076256 RepID=A0A2H3BKR7_9AGAR|nr:hypothetical protein ARMSODRAFT_1023041 [Armillaria solidipes]